MPIRVISFDMEGTLIDHSFSKRIWEEEVPRLYSKRSGLSLEESMNAVLSEYAAVGDRRLEWYDLDYWWRRLNLPGDWREKLTENVKSCIIYTDVPEVLHELDEKYQLVISSNTVRDFLRIQLKCIDFPFHRVYSAPSDFVMLKSDPSFFEKVCHDLEISPEELVHIGDHIDFDYSIPRSLGIRSFLLDRSGEMNGIDVIHSLTEFRQILRNM